MKRMIDRRKLGKAPLTIAADLLACLEYDDTSPLFERVRHLMVPATAEERWDELVADVKAAYVGMAIRQNRAFDEKMDRVARRLQQLRAGMPSFQNM